MAMLEQIHQGVKIIFDERDKNYYDTLLRLNERRGNTLFAVARGSTSIETASPSLLVTIFLVGAKWNEKEVVHNNYHSKKFLFLLLPPIERQFIPLVASRIEGQLLFPTDPLLSVEDGEILGSRFPFLSPSLINQVDEEETFSILRWSDVINRPTELQMLIEIARHRPFVKTPYTA